MSDRSRIPGATVQPTIQQQFFHDVMDENAGGWRLLEGTNPSYGKIKTFLIRFIENGIGWGSVADIYQPPREGSSWRHPAIFPQ